MDLTEEPKILSIAPSFSCSLKCNGCYLTTDVSKAMRDAEKSDYYWERAMELAKRYDYDQIAMTLNPFPGAFDRMLTLASKAKSLGLQVNVTWSPSMDFHRLGEMIGLVDILSISIDHERTWKGYWDKMSNDETIVAGASVSRILSSDMHMNYNVLWTPELFKQARNGEDLRLPDPAGRFTVQHLLMKPLSLYGDLEKFQEDYLYVMNNVIPIAGDGDKHIGDPAYGTILGVNRCPGERMIDLDPMGMARICPENPVYYDADNLSKLETIMREGLPQCGGTCTCLLS